MKIRSHLPLAVDGMIIFVHKHSLHGTEIGPVRRTERWTIPRRLP